jgi:ATP-dependent DNA helicase RecG
LNQKCRSKTAFSTTLFKNNLTQEQLTKLGLNDRQVKAVSFVKEKGRITNKEYQEINATTERTASRDLSDLVQKQIIKSSGVKGAGAFYTLT